MIEPVDLNVTVAEVCPGGVAAGKAPTVGADPGGDTVVEVCHETVIKASGVNATGRVPPKATKSTCPAPGVPERRPTVPPGNVADDNICN